MSKIAGIYWDDTAAAPGISLSVYFSGCHFHCPGCHNPEAQDFNYGREYDFDVREEIMKKLGKNGILRTLCILGGEPLADENKQIVSRLISFCRITNPTLSVYIWTGYTLDQLLLMEKADRYIHSILLNVAYIIDGLFELDKRDTTLRMRGSSNQRIWFHDKQMKKWERVE